MKFLDLNGLKYFLKFIDRTVSTPVSKYSNNSQNRCEIPFITNHQIINVNRIEDIEVFNWFKGASEGGILEIVPTTIIQNKKLYCTSGNISLIYKMNPHNSMGAVLTKFAYITLNFDKYIRLIKLESKLIVAEYSSTNLH